MVINISLEIFTFRSVTVKWFVIYEVVPQGVAPISKQKLNLGRYMGIAKLKYDV